MKSYAIIILLMFLIASCKDTNTTSVEQYNTTETATAEVVNKETTAESKPKNKGTFLCKINGKDWSYTKASGVVSRHKKTKKRNAIFTFTKQLDRGKESVQLYYDGDTYELEAASITLKFPKKDGGKMDFFYQLFPDTRKRNPESDLSGTIDLSNPTSASGNAEVSKLNIRFEKEKLEDIGNSVITLTDITFSDIGYSDAENLFGSKK
ncbi:hypothetical protein [Winogradskyella sp. R77965]|uniref:hypothetical protein n=1 Tax=Winogradskyella sp. R77965 TaxID=3093872 RepID=UPI0037DDC20F